MRELVLPTLYKKTSTGAIQQWEIDAYQEPGVESGIIRTQYGQVGGKQQTATDVIREGKNLGKANATTAVEQAHAEAKSQWEQKLKKGYVQSIEDAEAGTVDKIIAGGVAPMLAHTYEKQGHKIQFPAFAQPKLDGHRCIAVIQDGVCTLWSRTQKRINSMPHIVAALERMYGHMDIVLDGELYNHEYRDKFEQLTSKIRKDAPAPGHEVVQYWVYDIVMDEDQAWRIDCLDGVHLRAMMNEAHEIVVALPTSTVDDEEEMIAVFGAYMEQGYEGLILRNKAAKYKNKRSYDLQKVKTFDDAEFEVVRLEEGRGKMAGKALFVCKTDSGEEFRAKMVGNLDALANYLVEPERWIGQMLTVKFQGLSEKGIPRFPVALRFREDV